LINIAGENIFRDNISRVGLARDNIKNIKTRVDIIAGIDITITT
jgi:hypothetical protein